MVKLAFGIVDLRLRQPHLATAIINKALNVFAFMIINKCGR